jgi:hypothetical protein
MRPSSPDFFKALWMLRRDHQMCEPMTLFSCMTHWKEHSLHMSPTLKDRTFCRLVIGYGPLAEGLAAREGCIYISVPGVLDYMRLVRCCNIICYVCACVLIICWWRSLQIVATKANQLANWTCCTKWALNNNAPNECTLHQQMFN